MKTVKRRITTHGIVLWALGSFSIVPPLVSCQHQAKTQTAPWGDVSDTATTTLATINENGEMIMLTLNGPDTYYEYRGRNMGPHYMMAEKLAKHLGVALRVDICKDTLDMIDRLRNGEGDIICFPSTPQMQRGLLAVGNDGWLVAPGDTALMNAVNAWYKPDMLAQTRKEENRLLSTAAVKRHVYAFMLSAEKGTISTYDHLFKKYAQTAQMDWQLMAAQCYQESCFDPQAHSWAGACGLMQIMPTTADMLSLPRERIYDPEANIAAAARYMALLQNKFADVANPAERLKFALAAYNGGYNHVRDAMALTKKYGGIWQRWDDVKHYILALQQPQFYRDPIVTNGYMRGSETAAYVDMIAQRHAQYRDAIRSGKPIKSAVPRPSTTTTATSAETNIGLSDATPHRARKQ